MTTKEFEYHKKENTQFSSVVVYVNFILKTYPLLDKNFNRFEGTKWLHKVLDTSVTYFDNKICLSVYDMSNPIELENFIEVEIPFNLIKYTYK